MNLSASLVPLNTRNIWYFSVGLIVCHHFCLHLNLRLENHPLHILFYSGMFASIYDPIHSLHSTGLLTISVISTSFKFICTWHYKSFDSKNFTNFIGMNIKLVQNGPFTSESSLTNRRWITVWSLLKWLSFHSHIRDVAPSSDSFEGRSPWFFSEKLA